MASGKQLSFQYGEVSPTLRFRSNEMSYAEGLGKLRNMYVRRNGGVSNRPGFELVGEALAQADVPSYPGSPKIKGFVYWNYALNTWQTFEYAEYAGLGGYSCSVDGFPAVGLLGPTSTTDYPHPVNIRFTLLKDAVLITPPASIYLPPTIPPFNNNVYYDIEAAEFKTGYGQDQSVTIDITTPVLTVVQQVLTTLVATPATYMLTGTLNDNTEIIITESSQLTSSINHPNSSVYNTLYWALGGSDLSKLKALTLYRAAGNLAFGEKGYYKLCGRSLPPVQQPVLGVVGSGAVNTTSETVTFTNHGLQTGMLAKIVSGAIAGWVTATPFFVIVVNANTIALATTYANAMAGTKFDLNTVGNNTSVINCYPNVVFADFGADEPTLTPAIDEAVTNGTGTFGFVGLKDVVSAAYYQQRLIGSFQPGSILKPGDMIASKLGAPGQINAPLIYTNTGAFQFSVPVNDGSPVVALLPMERLIALTYKGVYIIRGGEQGVITPTSINPLKISEDGCSSRVEPKMIGRRGYFLNHSHTKLMCIEFGLDANVQVTEASIFNEHFLFPDVIMMEVVGGSEDTIYLLRKDGKLVRITVSQNGTHGWSLVEIGGEGFIESIYAGKVDPAWRDDGITYDTLFAYTVRNGKRLVERLSFRDDTAREAESFADCHFTFGWRLRFSETTGEHGWVMGSYVPDFFTETFPAPGYTNITTLTNYQAGSTVQVEFAGGVFNSGPGKIGYAQFFYEDADGVTQTLLCTIDASSATGAPGDRTYDCTFGDDIPAILQDVAGSSMSAEDKAFHQTRFLPAFTDIKSNTKTVALWKAANTNPGVAGTADVAVMADGEVFSSPLNPNAPVLSLEGNAAGTIVTLDLGQPVSWGYVGVPYECEFETLDLEASDSRTLTDAKKLLNQVGVGFYQSRGGFYGMPDSELTEMEEIQPRESENFSVQNENMNGHVVVDIPTKWTESGRVTINHVDPTPLTVLAVYPKGIAGD